MAHIGSGQKCPFGPEVQRSPATGPAMGLLMVRDEVAPQCRLSGRLARLSGGCAEVRLIKDRSEASGTLRAWPGYGHAVHLVCKWQQRAAQ